MRILEKQVHTLMIMTAYTSIICILEGGEGHYQYVSESRDLFEKYFFPGQ